MIIIIKQAPIASASKSNSTKAASLGVSLKVAISLDIVIVGSAIYLSIFFRNENIGADICLIRKRGFMALTLAFYAVILIAEIVVNSFLTKFNEAIRIVFQVAIIAAVTALYYPYSLWGYDSPLDKTLSWDNYPALAGLYCGLFYATGEEPWKFAQKEIDYPRFILGMFVAVACFYYLVKSSV